MVKSTDLDKFRGMADKRATESRRRRRAVVDDQAALKTRRDELEKHLFAAPARDWADAVEKARYLLMAFATDSPDPRLRKMVAALLTDFERLLQPPPRGGS
jgi:hypothetical protein